jgi:hypothetical protein
MDGRRISGTKEVKRTTETNSTLTVQLKSDLNEQ